MPQESSWTQLANGIFSRLGELKDQQRQQDDQQKGQVINLLTSLIPQVEPQSLPLLMGHIGDVIGIKDKGLKSFWSAFSGYPNKSVEEQLGETLKQATSQFTSPQQAQQTRQDYKDQLLQPYRDADTRPRTVAPILQQAENPPSLEGKIVFRDPRQERIDALNAQYGAQFNNREALLNVREDAIDRRAQEKENFLREKLNTEFENRRKLAQQGIADNLKKMYANLGAPPEIGEELANHFSGLNTDELSDEAKSFKPARVKLQEARVPLVGAQTTVTQNKANRPQSAQSGMDKNRSRMIDKFISDYQGSANAANEAQKSGDVRTFRIENRKANEAFGKLKGFSDQLEFGTDPATGQLTVHRKGVKAPSQGQGQGPSQSSQSPAPPRPTPAPQPSVKTATRLQIQQYANQFHMTEQQAEETFKHSGYTIQH